MASGRILKREKVLDNFYRGRIYAYIYENPGAHYNEIKNALEMNNGTAEYHLQVLEETGYLKSERCKFRRKFFRADSKEKRCSSMTDEEIMILKEIERKPGCAQKGIAEKFGFSPRKMTYYMNRLRACNLVRTEKTKSFNQCYPVF